MGNILMDYGLEQYRHEETMKLMEVEKLAKLKLIEDQKVMEAQKKADDSRALVNLEKLQGDVGLGIVDISSKKGEDGKAFDPNTKTQMFNELIKTKEEEFKTLFSPEHQVALAPSFYEGVYKTKSAFTERIIKETNDIANADLIGAVDGVMKSSLLETSVKKDKVRTLISNMNLDETQKTAKTIEALSQIDELAASGSLDARNDKGYYLYPDAMLKRLQATDASGNYKEFADLAPEKRAAMLEIAQNRVIFNNNKKEADAKDAIRALETRRRDALDRYRDYVDSHSLPGVQEEIAISNLLKGSEFYSNFQALREKSRSWTYNEAAFQKDPLVAGAAEMGITIKEPDATDPVQYAKDTAENMRIGEEIRRRKGLDYTPVITAQGAAAIEGMFKQDAKRGVAEMDKIRRALERSEKGRGERAMQFIAGLMSKTDKDTGLILGYLAQGDRQTAGLMAEGLDIIKSKSISMPKQKDMEEAFWDKGLNSEDRNARDMYDAFLPVYAVEATKRGVHDGTFNEGAAQAAFRQTVGSVVAYNGVKTTIPKEMDEDSFLNGVRGLDAERIKGLGGVYRMDNATAAERIREDGQFIRAGKDRFSVVIGGKVLSRADGKGPFTVSAQDLLQMPRVYPKTASQVWQDEADRLKGER
ncbi:MAG: hypothetical protein AABY51_10020 [Deltaproteobacteria bacterium]